MTGEHFTDYKVGDIVSVVYHGAQCAMVRVTKVNAWSMEGLDGDSECKVTKVGIGPEFRLYATLGPGRRSVLRHVQLKKLEMSNERQ